MPSDSAATRRATQRLAEWIVDATESDIPRDVRERIGLLVADSLGVMIAGAAEDRATGRLFAKVPAIGEATVYRAGLPRTTSRDAAVLNAVAMCALELDAGNRPSGHPMLHVLPLALATAESTGMSGADLEMALIVAYEAHARLQWAASLRSDVHAHGALASIGAVVALARLRRWDVSAVMAGLNAVASLPLATSWRNAIDGATIRNAYAAMGAMVAVEAARFAEAGFVSADGMLAEGYGRMVGDSFDAEALDRELGHRFWVRDAYVKYHSACALIHPVIDALAAALGADAELETYPIMRPQSCPDPGDVAAVRVWVPDRSTKLAFTDPSSPLGARFSIPHMAAYYVTYGESGPTAAGPAALGDERVRSLARRVSVLADRDLTKRWPEELGARVEVAMTDGSVLHGTCDNPFGSKGDSISHPALRAKFDQLVAGSLRRELGDAIWLQATNLSSLPDIRVLGHGGSADQERTTSISATGLSDARVRRGEEGDHTAFAHRTESDWSANVNPHQEEDQ